MNFQALLSAYFLLTVSFAESPETSPGVALTKTTKHESLSSINATTTTTTTTSAQKPKEPKSAGNFTLTGLELDGSMIQRALYVLIGITIIGVLYFLVRAVRLKKSNAQRKKYGLLSNYDDTVEMAQLESDEEDTTVYEAKSLRR